MGPASTVSLSMWNSCCGNMVVGLVSVSVFELSNVSITPLLLYTHSFICYQHYIIIAIKIIIKQQLRKPQLMLGFIKMKEASSNVVVVVEMMMMMSVLC
jgi:hypothetical protein